MAASTATITKPQRQPIHWPTTLAIGTPMMVATVRPIITMATDRARRSGGETLAATRAATPK
jgi:hypothetical protein